MFRAKFNHPDKRTFEQPDGASFDNVEVQVTDTFIRKDPTGGAVGIAKMRVLLQGVGIFEMPFQKAGFDYETPAVEQMYNKAKELKITLRGSGKEVKELPFFENIENI